MAGPGWKNTLLIWNFDEHGGYYDHVVPPRAIAPDNIPPTIEGGSAYTGFKQYGFRVPCVVVSPWAKPGHLEGTLYEHSSILKFIESVFGLPTLASVNHQFDIATPVGSNYQAAPAGATTGPPAPPRDGRRDIGNLMECFSFS